MKSGKQKKLNRILSLFLVINPMNQNIFANEIHTSESKKDEKIVDNANDPNAKPKNEKIEVKKEIKKQNDKSGDKKTKDYKKIATIITLSALGIGGTSYAGYYFGVPMYAKCKFDERCPSKKVSWAKYMDKQPRGENYWCQFYAFQGILNKEFNIKCKVTDLYDIAFPNESDHRDEKKFMLTEDVRKDVINKIIAKYGITRKPYVVVKDMAKDHKDKDNFINQQDVKRELSDAYIKCGSLCINTNYYSEHAILVTGLNRLSNEITIETYGMRYVCDLDVFVAKLAYNEYNYSKKPGDCLHDGKLRIYGFEK